jgi:lactose/L-arabinose transport system substrate-binding protein
MVLTLVFSITACSKKSGTTDDSSTAGTETKNDAAATTPAATAEDAAATDGDNSLTVWCWDPAFNIYAMQEAEKEYQKTNPNFKLNIVEITWDDIQPKLTAAGSSGDYSTLPDIFLMQDNAFQKNYANTLFINFLL